MISLAAKGLATGEIAAHFADVCGAEVSRDTISRITDRVLEEMAAWQNRPLDSVYPVVFIAVIVGKIRDGQVASRPVYTVVGVGVDGTRDVLGPLDRRRRRRREAPHRPSRPHGSAVRSLDPTAPLNAFAVTFEGRIDLNND